MFKDLFQIIKKRKLEADDKKSYTAKLLKGGTELIAQKVGEEAVELVISAVNKDKAQVKAESADLIYHLMVLWANLGIEPEEVQKVLASREGTSGLEEKASRKS